MESPSPQNSEPPAGHGRRAFLRTAAIVPVAAGFGVLTMGTAQAYNWSRTLKSGDSGADVKELQIRIAGWAADSPKKTYVAVDGEFGPGTEAALKRFQRAYGVTANGVADSSTHTKLNALEGSGGSTAHFNFSEFYSKDGSRFSGGKVGESTVKENVRRLMYKLEAVRKKVGNKPMTINSGFRSKSHNSKVGGASNSQHLYGIAADFVSSGVSTRTFYVACETSGFSGLERYTVSWQHADSRVEYPYGSQSWWWESGVVT
ncbi:Putative peptidoglycan binding domain-containing protein [Amycolatopsis marina]|uniref:Peptidoglycan binding domain-containing protein n=1 Tax=Amycolatopsis marina TaxID=490629 RepID=A0A1I1A6X1_9PSEU|nr:D-Ala-D-Ala carboxypeptidase family metallohydrolase [Amycolatopsis marina]SFB33739.1 Putative peptidoglycan binding domain-containing protein [Amycolatopsis marina]